MATFAQRFGRAVQQVREDRGLSQQKAAAATKIDRAYYWKIEHGRANVSLEVIARIVKGLRVTPGELFSTMDRQ